MQTRTDFVIVSFASSTVDWTRMLTNLLLEFVICTLKNRGKHPYWLFTIWGCENILSWFFISRQWSQYGYKIGQFCDNHFTGVLDLQKSGFLTSTWTILSYLWTQSRHFLSHPVLALPTKPQFSQILIAFQLKVKPSDVYTHTWSCQVLGFYSNSFSKTLHPPTHTHTHTHKHTPTKRKWFDPLT